MKTRVILTFRSYYLPWIICPLLAEPSLTNEQLVCTMSDQKYTVAPRNNDFFCAGQQNCNLFGGPYYETFLFFFFLTVRQLDAPTSLKLDDYD